MAKFELSIYGTNDEVIKKYETNHIPFGLTMDAAKLKEELAGETAVKQYDAIVQFIKTLFEGLTDEEIRRADYEDVVNTFNQVISAVGQIKGGNSKNA